MPLMTWMQNLSLTHPGAKDVLRNGGSSVAWSIVPGRHNPVEMTIWQTVNHAAKTPSAVMGFFTMLQHDIAGL